jgi:acetyl-CoA carboxylase biotin carboxyl carrier protein
VRREAGAQIVAPAIGSSGPVAPPASDGASAPIAPPNVKRVTAPLTGVFYRSSSPDAEPFVNLGDRVEDGSVLCILEAMKLFNEIQSDYSGSVARIFPENGELVSQGDELFWIAP